jgi:hypothetical protein
MTRAYGDGMQIPGLGQVVKDDRDWYRSAAIPVPVLGGGPCRFIVEGYDTDPSPEDFVTAIRAFLALDPSVLRAAAPSVFAYYRDVMDIVTDESDDDGYVAIDGPDSVFDHVRFGSEPLVTRDRKRGRYVYVSVECECDWEPEHGLQIVFRKGAAVTKVGPFDGHLTNAAAYPDDALFDTVYYSTQ